MVDYKESLVEIVGAANVYDNLNILETYSRDCSFVQQRTPRLIVKPKDSTEVHEIVKWAKQASAPLVPVSSGPPHFNGDTVPAVEGAIIIDLSRMKRIIRIDRRTRMMVIEPGITYGEIQTELASHNLRLSTPLLPRANKSVIASLLERQPTIVPKYQWTLPEPLRCLEIIMGNGYKLMTGEAGESILPSLEEQWKVGMAQMQAPGPRQVDYHRLVSAAQGTMGIVTWASIKCEILPQVHKFLLIQTESIENLIDTAYTLLKFRLGDEFLILNNLDLAIILSDNSSQIKQLRNKLPPLVMIIGIAGRDMLPDERVTFQEGDIKDILQKNNLKPESAINGISSEQVMKAILNTSKEPYWKLCYKGACQDIFFLSTLDNVPEFVGLVCSTFEALGYPSSDLGIYIQPQQQGVSCHCEFNIPYDPYDQKEADIVREVVSRASEELAKHGAFFSRPYGDWVDIAFKKDVQETIVLKKIKEIFDPSNILNPGKLCF